MKTIDKQQLIDGIASGDTRMLSKAITLAESTIEEQRNIALDIIEHFGPQENTFRIGITGTPGAGKSTLIEALGTEILKDSKRKIAVLSVDPSSKKSHGSILGDKTRMNTLSASPRAYIRPTASGNQMGGLAKNTRLAMLLCEAAGFNTILIESVGVGQGETEIAQLADLFVLVLNPGGGDELQGIKRGIMEMAEVIVINKADGDAEKQANLTAKEYSMALHLMPEYDSKWMPKVLTISALKNKGIDVFWNKCLDYEQHVLVSNWKGTHRKKQMIYWTKKSIHDLLLARIKSYDVEIAKELKEGVLPEKLAQKLLK
ncbi:MAG: methylmalonyl Co-A mutase-associated GTPase MeaB [Bacteroidia bacterium]|nr:methylmalonyl Co-A mutase-associated GTPase MeaB [Bacteroidia bacterium]NNJ55505.1 methylmalonyl Co-A mutase-associated GTPase MeaB [Bacteroidia bacterium]